MASERPTSAASWAAKPELVELPSGKKARLRKTVNVYAALRAGVLTAQHVADFHASQIGELDDVARGMALQDALICWLFVEPRCVLEEKAQPRGAIHISDVDDEDLDFLIARAFGGAPEEGTFPDAGELPRDGRGDRAREDGEGVADDAEPDRGDGSGDADRVPDRPPPRRAPRRAPARKRARG